MTGDLFTGELVRLAAQDPEALAKEYYRWNRDSEYLRLLDDCPPRLWSEKKIKEWIEKSLEKDDSKQFVFTVRTLQDDKLIGFVELTVTAWMHGEAWVGIGIGDRSYWGKGYGTDSMRVLLRYAFMELNLYRVTLGVFGYNSRALRSYEKAGFVLEGREREFIYRDGSRADGLLMGILRPEWLAKNGYPSAVSE